MTQGPWNCATALAAMGFILMAAPLAAQWSAFDSVNEYGEVTGKAAASEWTAPVRPLAAPYEDVKARVVVNDFGVHLEFTVPPNLVGGQTNDGYDPHYLRGRWDGVPVSSFMVDQGWGDTSLHFYADKKKVRRIVRHEALSVAMDWCRAGRLELFAHGCQRCVGGSRGSGAVNHAGMVPVPVDFVKSRLSRRYLGDEIEPSGLVYGL